ncbi:type II secretion system F family protein [Desulfonatronum sp. SC1]|uniref:type II secretion system F family protein n=1 Tax=Desulfonatronum sp. SC1 TaxID=2109626 RepID=UPI000D30FEE4|nr:type II secretion system F family protein [Desulfonatronum sp. SC1]PTN31503.1 type II secretion protein F [Desulfonatronum sp. SC1]
MSMQFHYKAVTPDGKLTQGTLTADGEDAVALSLQRRNLVVLKVNPSTGDDDFNVSRTSKAGVGSRAESSFWAMSAPLFAGKPGSKDLIRFAENLAILLKAGIPLSRGLGVLAELMEKRSFRTVISDVSQRIRGGSSLWQALQHHSAVFPPVFVNMVRAGESAGVLEVVLARLAEYQAGIQELREYLVSSMIYPGILGLTAAGSIVVMLTLVIPKFAVIFADIGIELPMATRIMLGAGDFLQAYWLILVGLCVALGVASHALVRMPQGRLAWDKFKLTLPVLGPLFHKIEVARFSRTLGTLLGSGLSMLGAVNIGKGVVMNTVLRNALDQVYDDLKEGRMLSTALEQRGMFPLLAVHMLAVGEETGALDTMLNKVGEMYDKDLKRSIKSFTSLFEPLVILVMGLVIGVMVVSMLLAIFSINELGM